MLTKKIMGAGGFGTPPSGDDYWVVEVSDVRLMGDVLVNSSDDVIAAFGDLQAIGVVSLDKNGVENWQKKYAYSTYDSSGFKYIGVDSSDNIYISTVYNSGLGSSGDIALIKTSASTQAVLAQAGISSSASDTAYAISVDSSDNIYQTLYYNDGTVSTAGLAKYDSSLSLDWIYKFNDGTNVSLFRATAVDSSGYIYAGGYAKEAGTYEFRPTLVKLNSSGTVQWIIKTTNTISTLQNGEDYGGIIRSIIVDSSDNVYIAIAAPFSGSGFTKRLHVLKFNSSGTVQWHKQFSSTATNPAGPSGNLIGMCITTGGVLGACWDDGTEVTYTTAIVGLDPSDGSVSWQRNINKKSYSSLHAHPLGGWCFSVAADSSPYGGYIARLPDDGTLTGLWGNLTYSESSRWVSATGGMTWGSSSISAVSDSPTETTPSYAAATSSYTLTKTTDPVLKGFVTKAVADGGDWDSGNTLDVLSIADEGDLVVIAFSVDNSTTSWSWEGMAFTAIEDLTDESTPGTYVGYRVVQAGDSNPYLSGDASDLEALTAIAAIFRPVYTTFENSANSDGFGSSLDPPSVTATADLWIITGHLDDDFNSTFTAPSGYVLVGTAGDPSVGSGTCMCYKVASLTSENPGAITSSTSDGWYAVTAAFS
jgi:hypothetical protein